MTSTECPTVKYVDDTTIYHMSNSAKDTSLQSAVDTAILWSKQNSMRLNASKTKELLLCYSKCPPQIPHITIDGEPIARVHACTLLSIDLNDSLSWSDHISKMYKKASKRLYFLSQLRRTKLDSKDIVKVFVSLVRPILEYSCQLWHAGLNTQQEELLESIQERALAMAYPSLSYPDALKEADIPTLVTRREDLRKRLFYAAQTPTHKLHRRVFYEDPLFS